MIAVKITDKQIRHLADILKEEVETKKLDNHKARARAEQMALNHLLQAKTELTEEILRKASLRF